MRFLPERRLHFPYLVFWKSKMASYDVLPSAEADDIEEQEDDGCRLLKQNEDSHRTRYLKSSRRPTLKEGGNGITKAAIIRNLFGFWLLGLCNNYAYVIMLSAAHDVLDQDQGGDGTPVSSNSSSYLPERDCNAISTGAILLANIVPGLLIKIFAPFVLGWTFLQVAFVVATAFLSLIVVSFSTAQWMTFLGVSFASVSSSVGEVTLLRYSTGFDKNVVSTWSSGTGASGVLGAFSYAAITTAGLSPRSTLLVMLFIPFVMAFTFCFLLVHPPALRKMSAKSSSGDTVNSEESDLVPVLSFKRKIAIMKGLIPYMIPLSLVYFAEYFINQGLLELVNIHNSFLTHSEQYRWYQVDYQIGVFISRSSVNLAPVNKLWLLPFLQFVNVIFFTFEAYYLFLPSVWIVFAFVLFEGLLGGSSYVNTFYKITQEVAESDRELSMGAASMGDSFGIALAGLVAIPVHDLLCRTKIP